MEGPGISELIFPVQIEQASSAEFSLEVSAGDVKDTVTSTVTVRPFGFPVYASTSGTSGQSTIALVKLDEKLKAQDASLE